MTTISTTRTATADETAREMDRRGEVIERLEADISAAAAEITRLRAENAGMREALDKVPLRFEHCAAMIAQGFGLSGTARAEHVIKARHYALEARAALSNSSQAEGQKP